MNGGLKPLEGWRCGWRPGHGGDSGGEGFEWYGVAKQQKERIRGMRSYWSGRQVTRSTGNPSDPFLYIIAPFG